MLCYLLFVVVVMFVVMVVINIFVIFEFVKVFKGFGVELLLMICVLIGIFDFFVCWWLVMLVGVIGVFVVVC